MRRSNFALRLQPSLLEELRKAAGSEGVALNQLINVAVAEKVSALRTEEYFQQRAHRADRTRTLSILEKAGNGNRHRIFCSLRRLSRGACWIWEFCCNLEARG